MSQGITSLSKYEAHSAYHVFRIQAHQGDTSNRITSLLRGNVIPNRKTKLVPFRDHQRIKKVIKGDH